MINTLQTQVDWDELLESISDKTIIPVVGNEVYKFLDEGKLVSVDDFIANKLIKEQNLDTAEQLTLAQTAGLLSKQKNMSVRDVNRLLKETVEGINFSFPVLQNFISIDQLFFYFNTTVYNNILESTIQKVRKQSPSIINFSIRSRFNDCDNIDELTAPYIFNVFGSFKSTDPAISEEEMLEFTTSFREKMNDNAINILDALKNKSLLFLGCTYPDWLIRFFLRVLSNERINDWLNRQNHIIVVNDQSEHREKQYSFLKNYNADTYEGNTDEFVQELASRWRKLNPEKVKQKLIFLSYTQNDKQAVENLKNALTQINGVTCWYDKDELHSGDNFEFTIVDNIRKADIFMPLISGNSLTQQDKYVLDEWFKADTINKVRELDGRKERYLMPVVIDDVDLNNSIIKKFYAQLSIEKIPGGIPDPDFIDRVKANLNVL